MKEVKTCLHCGSPCPEKAEFCCTGCENAYHLLEGLDLISYYSRREISSTERPLIPEALVDIDFTPYIQKTEEVIEGKVVPIHTIHLMVKGIHCAACVWLIETVLARTTGVTQGRMNMSLRQLKVSYRSDETTLKDVLSPIQNLGYNLMPYDPACLTSLDKREEKSLLIAMAVAGFAAANVMLLSVSLWAGAENESATRALFEWVSALISLPTAAFAGQTFYQSALSALKTRRINMDVPISLAIILSLALSVYETIYQTGSSYFDSAMTLLFFLLIGRYLDRKSKSGANNAALKLMSLKMSSATILQNGQAQNVPSESLKVGQTLLVHKGEIFAADGRVLKGKSSVDSSLMSGEALPRAVQTGAFVAAGMMNLENPLEVEITAQGENTNLAHIKKLMDEAMRHKNRYTRMADKAAQFYAPMVHILAFLTFVFWVFWSRDVHMATVHAIAVLIITCPCALALAIPSVQVAASTRLMRSGILIMNSSALEKVTTLDALIFDKTGTLTQSTFQLQKTEDMQKHEDFPLACALAVQSSHILAQSLVKEGGSLPQNYPLENIHEVTGQGVQATYLGTSIRLGSAAFCGVSANNTPIEKSPQGCQLVFQKEGAEPIFFIFKETLKQDALFTVHHLQKMGYDIHLLSGDTPQNVAPIATELGIEKWQAQTSPQDKHAYIQNLQKQGLKTCMIGDGINDAPALALADISISFASGSDIARNSADIICQSDQLESILTFLTIAQTAHKTCMSNFSLSLTYNLFAVPLAMAGLITPLLAAVLMSASSLTVMLNALKLLKKGNTA